MKSLLLCFFVVVLSTFVRDANACASVSSDDRQTFFVSGVMKKNGEDATIKLMHSVIRERSENEALQAFVRAAIAQHPGYKMASVLASKEASIACEKANGISSL